MRGFSTLLLILLVGIVSLGIFFIYSISAKKTQPKSNVQPVTMKTYVNSTYGYKIGYPDTLAVREFPDTKTGAGFRPANMPEDPQYEVITINVLEKNADLVNDPLAEYAKVAASIQIQNYQKLNSINPVTTDSGVTGYQTTWMVTPLAILGATQSGQPTVSLPITYFDAPKAPMPSTVQVTLSDENYMNTYETMIKTFGDN